MFEPGMGAKGLLTVEDAVGVRTCGEHIVVGEPDGPPMAGATAYGCIVGLWT